MLLKDFLRREAKFLSPEPQSDQDSSSGVSDVEVVKLHAEWNPTAARHDPLLVDSLIKVLEDAIADVELPEKLPQDFDSNRRTFQDSWFGNEQESDASIMVYTGALALAVSTMRMLGHQFEARTERTAPNFRSRVDYLLRNRAGKTAVVEIKSPGVFAEADSEFFGRQLPFRLALRANASTTAQKVVNKLCLYMGAHQTEWGALTCHDKWVFVRLHKGTDKGGAYISYSTVEGQTDNTRIFRALLGMLLATDGAAVESHVDLNAQLEAIEEEREPSGSSGGSQGSEGSQEGSEYDPANDSPPSEEGSRSGPPPRRPPAPRTRRLDPDILLGWSPRVTPADEWLQLSSVLGAGKFSSLESKPIRMWLQREIGWGSTGRVYHAEVDAGVHGRTPTSYAIKTVKKGTSENAKARIKRFQGEISVYCLLEEVRASGKQVKAAPRCYGLYETSMTLFVVLDYVGEPLSASGLRDLDQADKMSLFRAIQELHAVGITHRDLEPRNIMRDSDGSLKLIDFTQSTFHRCPGYWANNVTQRGDSVCSELRTMYKRLVHPEPFPFNIAVM